MRVHCVVNPIIYTKIALYSKLDASHDNAYHKQSLNLHTCNSKLLAHEDNTTHCLVTDSVLVDTTLGRVTKQEIVAREFWIS